MITVSDRIRQGPFVSVELRARRTQDCATELQAAVRDLGPLSPGFVSVTYGAGGTTHDLTHDLVVRMAGSGLLPLPHLTCVAQGRAELARLVERYRDAGVKSLFALRGDPPRRGAAGLPADDVPTALDLVRLAREAGISCLGVAVHPTRKPVALLATDRDHQAAKLREADFGLTQHFFESDEYFAVVDDLIGRGATTPVVPGVMPITDVHQVERLAAISATRPPAELAARLDAAAGRPDEIRRIGVDHATKLCQALLDGGAPGLHFYTRNALAPTLEVCGNLGLLTGSGFTSRS